MFRIGMVFSNGMTLAKEINNGTVDPTSNPQCSGCPSWAGKDAAETAA